MTRRAVFYEDGVFDDGDSTLDLSGGGGGLATGTSLPGSPSDGDGFLLRVGSTPYDFVLLVYDGTYTKWVSSPVPLLSQVPNSAAIASTSYTTEIGTKYTHGDIFNYSAKKTAGLRVQFRLKALFGSGVSGATAYAQLQGSEWSDADTSASSVFTVAEISTLITASAFKISAWTEPSSWTPADDHLRIAVQTKATNVTNAATFQLGAEYRWVSA